MNLSQNRLLMFADARERVSNRYQSQCEISFDLPQNHEENRLEKLNHFLLNGVGSGWKNHERPLSLQRYEDRELTGLSKHVVHQAFVIRIAQRFVDGNHRTAILWIFECLADAGFVLNADPVDFYIILSNRQQKEYEECEIEAVQLVKKGMARRVDQVKWTTRMGHALRVKAIPKWNTFFEDIDETIVGRRSRLSTKRRKWRQFKQKSRKRFEQFRRLYPRSHPK